MDVSRHACRHKGSILLFLFSAMYPVLEVEGGVEQHVELPSSPRPATPQTPNTPMSPQGEDLPHSQPSLLDFGTQLPTATPHGDTSTSAGVPPARTATVQPKVSMFYAENFQRDNYNFNCISYCCSSGPLLSYNVSGSS